MKARLFHTYAVFLILKNYSRFVLQRSPPQTLAPVMEHERLVLVDEPDKRWKLPSNKYDSPDTKSMSLADKWFAFLSDPFFDDNLLITPEQ